MGFSHGEKYIRFMSLMLLDKEGGHKRGGLLPTTTRSGIAVARWGGVADQVGWVIFFCSTSDSLNYKGRGFLPHTQL